MKLFEGEHILTTTDGNAIILTSHRIRSTESNAWGAFANHVDHAGKKCSALLIMSRRRNTPGHIKAVFLFINSNVLP